MDLLISKDLRNVKHANSTNAFSPSFAGSAITQTYSLTSHAELRNFMAPKHRPFLNAVEPLLFHDSCSDPVPSPYIMQLHPGIPSLEFGAVSSLYELSCTPEPDADVKSGLGIETQSCRSFFNEAARGTRDDGLFLGLDAVWLEEYYAIPLSFFASATLVSPIEVGQDRETKQRTILIVTERASQDGERAILHSGRIEESPGGRAFTAGDSFARNLLQKASGYTKYHVTFENVLEANVKGLDE